MAEIICLQYKLVLLLVRQDFMNNEACAVTDQANKTYVFAVVANLFDACTTSFSPVEE